MNSEQKHIVLFDGICTLCNGVVQFIFKNDKTGKIQFASLQSDIGQQLIHQYQIPGNVLDSFIFISNGQAYTKSQAAFQVSTFLKGIWPTFRFFNIMPLAISNGIYDFVASNRYKVLGKKEQCMIPSPELQKRFLN